MKRRCLTLLLLLLTGYALSAAPSPSEALADASALRDKGDFRGAATLLNSALKDPGLSPAQRHELSFQLDVLGRIRLDYPYTRTGLYEELAKAVQGLTADEFQTWLNEGRFDGKIIDGKLMYVGTSVANLFFRHPELNGRRTDGRNNTAEQKGRLLSSIAIEKAAREEKTPCVLPHYFLCTMNVTTHREAVLPPPGSDTALIRAWLPIPREYPYQKDFKLIDSSSPVLATAPADSPIRSAYMEQASKDGAPTTFSITYSYMRSGVYFDMDPAKVHACDPNDPELKKYTEEAPHVVFTDRIKALADKVAGGETNPYRVAKAYFDWIGSNIQYSYAREYSTLANISDYCLTNRYGDCGQEAMLFITLCRYRGIPARWQTGWDFWPGAHDIHDWSEIYLAPYGWVPVDPWAGLFATRYCTSLTGDQRRALHDFYFGGLDCYRMAANSDHSQLLDPPKKTLRSDDIDFQRGELETASRDIYFNQYSYHMNVEDFGCAPFSVGDLKNFPDLTGRLVRHADPFSDFLWRQLSAKAQTLLRDSNSSGPDVERARQAVVNTLNKLIQIGQPGIFSTDRFAGVTLPPETAALLKEKPDGIELSRLNRELIEAACPDDLARSQD